MNTDTFRENSVYLNGKASCLYDIKHSMYRELAIAYKNSVTDTISPDDVCGVYAGILGVGEMFCPLDFSVLCTEFSTVFTGKVLYNEDDNEKAVRSELPKFVYFRNAYSDRAYSVFSSCYKKSSAVYCADFKDALEELYYERASFAILPVYSSSDGMLLSFHRQIYKYDLKIRAMTDVSSSDGTFTRYAMLSKHLPALSPDENERYMYLSAVTQAPFTLGSFIFSLENLGVAVTDISTASDHPDSTDAVYVHLDMSHADKSALRLFLEGSHIRFDILGLYNIM